MTSGTRPLRGQSCRDDGERPNPDALIAQAFGTLSPAGAQDVAGERGSYEGGKWAVVFSRPFTLRPLRTRQSLPAGRRRTWLSRSGTARARGPERQKSTSTFVTLRLGSALAGGGGDNDGVIIALGLAVFFGVTRSWHRARALRLCGLQKE
ncbi:MAG: hypothetical protein R3C29_02975 [Dehalococcoidia bacterium]